MGLGIRAMKGDKAPWGCRTERKTRGKKARRFRDWAAVSPLMQSDDRPLKMGQRDPGPR